MQEKELLLVEHACDLRLVILLQNLIFIGKISQELCQKFCHCSCLTCLFGFLAVQAETLDVAFNHFCCTVYNDWHRNILAVFVFSTVNTLNKFHKYLSERDDSKDFENLALLGIVNLGAILKDVVQVLHKVANVWAFEELIWVTDNHHLFKHTLLLELYLIVLD